MNIKKIRNDIISGNLSISNLLEDDKIQTDLALLYEQLMKQKVWTKDEFEDAEDLLMIYLDVYNYSEGDVLISDHKYDMLMCRYIDNGGDQLTCSDTIKDKTKWDFVQHEQPGVVGSIKKIYSMDELMIFWHKCRPSANGIRKFILAPKYDGISSGIKIVKKKGIQLGVTRNDGVKGQDITKLILNTKNGKTLSDYYGDPMNNEGTLWIKTELVVKTEDFNKLLEEASYANRRSATSGIINTPKNLHLAKYVTILPLAIYHEQTDVLEYTPPDSVEIATRDPYYLMDEIENMLSKIRDSSFPIRTDGVVIYPVRECPDLNHEDFMDRSIAFKVNTEEALTRADYGYVSVGRLGRAVPMLHVKPVEVNETIVQDVSLSTFDKFLGMDIHENEQVLVYAAGNVIPQAKLPNHRSYKKKAKLIEIPMVCPYCGKKLKRDKAIYSCANQSCPRIISGKISNFITKLGVENVSDKTIEDLMNAGLLREIIDIFDVTVDEIVKLDGYAEVSADMIVGEFEKLKKKEVPISSLLGALGIQGISKKKCRLIIQQMESYKDLYSMEPNRLQWDLTNVDGIGLKTASVFVEFITENREMIEDLLYTMNIVNDPQYLGNVVFTGFRDPELEEKFNEVGYEVSGNVNSKTACVIDASYSHDSTKCEAAKRKGLEIYHKSDADKIVEFLSKNEGFYDRYVD